MKYYDYTKAKKIIKEHSKKAISADIGMARDWYWTAQTVWEKGKYLMKLQKGDLIAGINGSYHDMPQLILYFPNGFEKKFDITTVKQPKQKLK